MNIKNELLKKIGLLRKADSPQAAQPNSGQSEIENPKSEIQRVDFRNPSTRREPRGKVAHLPPPIRQQVCEWIYEGVTLEEIARNLAEIGRPGFNHKNISNWKENGYRTWCQYQERHERARLRAEDTVSFAAEKAYSDALVAAAQIDVSNGLEEAQLAFDPHGDLDTQHKQSKIILNQTLSLSLLSQQRERTRKTDLQEQYNREKLELLRKKHSGETTPAKPEANSSATASATPAPVGAAAPTQAPPATEEDQRKAFLGLVDKWLGIRPFPQPAGVRPSSASPEGRAATTKSKQIVEQPTAPESAPADPCTSAFSPQPSDLPSSLQNSNFSSGSLWKVPANNATSAQPISSPESENPQSAICNPQLDDPQLDDPQSEIRDPQLKDPQPEDETRAQEFTTRPDSPATSAFSPQPSDFLEPWERLLESPSLTPNFLPQPEPLPKPYAADAKPISELPIPRLKIAYPPAPLIQPEGKLALCNYNGVVTAWIDKSEDPTKPKPSIEPIKNHKTGQIICWFDYHSRPPGMTDEDAVRGQPHFVPVFDGEGRIVNWVPEPDGKHKRPPTLTATALVSDQLRAHFAWMDPASTHAALMPHAYSDSSDTNPSIHGGGSRPAA